MELFFIIYQIKFIMEIHEPFWFAISKAFEVLLKTKIEIPVVKSRQAVKLKNCSESKAHLSNLTKII